MHLALCRLQRLTATDAATEWHRSHCSRVRTACVFCTNVKGSAVAGKSCGSHPFVLTQRPGPYDVIIVPCFSCLSEKAKILDPHEGAPQARRHSMADRSGSGATKAAFT